MIRMNPSRTVPWTNSEISTLRVLVNEAMQYRGYVNFEDISRGVGRTAHACESRAYKLDMVFTQDKSRTGKKSPDNLIHSNGERVFYG